VTKKSQPTPQQTAADPFGGNFSQARITPPATRLPTMQWHGGNAALVGDIESVKATGGFFIEDERLVDLGLVPNAPPATFERLALRLGGKAIPGWGAAVLHLAAVLDDFCWEDRATGETFQHTEYQRRKTHAPGTEKALRGRTRVLAGIKELLDEGVTEPVVISVRGIASAALNAILQDAKRMADEATKLRRRAGHEGAVPREAFYVPVFAGDMREVGKTETSTLSLPETNVPEMLDREYLVGALVPEEYRRPGGLFDEWVTLHGEAWEKRAAEHQGEEEGEPAFQAATVEDLTPRGQVLHQIAQLHASMGDVADETSTDEQWEALLAAMGAAGLVHSDYDRLASALLGEAVDPDELSQAECLAMTAFVGTSDGKRWLANGGLR
jgi:hypothetical protein